MKEIRLDHNINQDEFTEYVVGNYDINDVSTIILNPEDQIDKDGDWNIGLIVGNSGSGKSTILKTIGEPKSHVWDDSVSMISNFKGIATPEDSCKILASVGLGSVPSWLRPYSTLSNGEKHRADMAMAIANRTGDIITFDEFTSVVNRDVAKAISHSIQKYARRENVKIILASCHYDIIDWLQPDWIHDCQNGEIVKKKSNEDLQSTWRSFVVRTRHGLSSADITI